MQDNAPEPRIPDPSAELMLIGSLVFAVSGGKPREIRRTFRLMKVWLNARRELATVISIRDRRFDRKTLEEIDLAINWRAATELAMQRITPRTRPSRFKDD